MHSRTWLQSVAVMTQEAIPPRIAPLESPTACGLVRAMAHALLILVVLVTPRFASAQCDLTENGTVVKNGPGVVEDQPRIVGDGAGGSFVCWSDASNGTDLDVFVAHLDATGTLTAGWPIDVTPHPIPGDQHQVRMVADGTGGVYVAWTDERTGYPADIYGVRLTNTGSVVSGWGASVSAGAGGIPICGVVGRQDNPNMVLASDGTLLVAWIDGRNSDPLSIQDVYAQKMSPNGSQLWGGNAMQASAFHPADGPPAIASDGNRGVYIAFESQGGGYLQAMNSSGVPQLGSGLEFVNSTSNSAGGLPVLVADGNGGVIIAYLIVNGTTSDLGASKFTAAENVWNAVVCGANGNQTRPALVPDGLGGAIITWLDDRSGALMEYASRILPDGTLPPGWPMNGLQVTPSPVLAYSVDVLGIAADGSGGATLAWAVPQGNGDIYTRGVYYNGCLGPITALCTDALSQDAPVVAFTANRAGAVTWLDARCSGTNTGVFAASIITQSILPPTLGIASGVNTQALSWIGPLYDYTLGLTTSFDIRTSSAPIDESNWDQATFVANVPSSGPPGTQYCYLVSTLQQCTTYYYAIRTNYTNTNCSGVSQPLISKSQKTKCTGSITVSCGAAVTMDREPSAPLTLELSQPWPVPARDGARFNLAIPASHEGEDVEMMIHDLLGRRVRGLLHETAHAGQQQIEWRLDTDAGTRVSPGVYFAKLRVGSRVFTRTVVVQP